MSSTTGTWKKITSEDAIIRWTEPGQSAEGMFCGGKPSGDKKNLLYTFARPDGTEWKCWETYVLKDLLAKVPEGETVRITYTGIRGKTKLFEVALREA